MNKQKNKKQSIEFTKKQFKALLKVVYLGNWVVNAIRTFDRIEEYERIENYIFSFASKFGFEKYVSHEEIDENEFYPTAFFEESTDVQKLLKEYDENIFWDELADRLAGRDMSEQYSIKEIKQMSREEWFVKYSERIDKYKDELAEFGIDRLRVEKN